MTMEENMAEGNGPDFGRSRIQLVEDVPVQEVPASSTSFDSATHYIPLNSPTSEPIPEVTPPRRQSAAPVVPPVNPPAASNTTMSTKALLEYFAFRDGGHTLAKAVEKCLPIVLQSDQTDGNLIGVWMLTEISHWDVDQERLVFLTEHTLIVAKYDLIQMVLLEYRRVPLRIVDKMMFGVLKYPPKSILEERHQIGLRLTWNSNVEIPASQRWNPFSEVPYCTLTSHNAVPIVASVASAVLSDLPASFVPLAEQPAGGRQQHADMSWCRVEDFKEKVKTTCAVEAQLTNGTFQFTESDILIENYAGIISRAFNVAQLGFFKSRGRVSF